MQGFYFKVWCYLIQVFIVLLDLCNSLYLFDIKDYSRNGSWTLLCQKYRRCTQFMHLVCVCVCLKVSTRLQRLK